MYRALASTGVLGRCCRISSTRVSSIAPAKKAYTASRLFSTENASTIGGAGRSPITWAGLGVIGAVGGVTVWYYQNDKERRKKEAIAKNTKSIGKPAIGGQWTLVDHTGRPVTDATLKEGGHSHALLYFGFTYCPDICPAELIKMQEIIDKLDTDEAVGPCVLPVFITCDPNRDGITQIAHYIKDFHPRTLGLTGTPEQIKVACKAFRVYHSVADQDLEDEDDYLVDHSIVMYLVGPDGMFEDFYTQLTEADEAVARIKKIILEQREKAEETE